MQDTMQAPAPGTASLAPAWEPEIDTTLTALVTRATTDADFRARALGDPARAFAEVAGRPLPARFTLKLFDNARAHLSVVLPPAAPGAPAPPDPRPGFTPGAEWTEEEARLAAEAVVARARADVAWRAHALADPARAVEALTGKALPAGFVLRLLDGEGATRAVILPDMPEARVELSETELAAVAGGGKSFKQVFSGVFGVLGAATGGIVGMFVAPAGVGIDIGTAAISSAACS